MSDEGLPQPNTIEMVSAPKVTVSFERTVQVRPYESAKASVFIQADVPMNASPEDLEKGLRDAFFQAKATVYEQIGLEFEINEHGVVMEVLTKAFGPVEMVKAQAAEHGTTAKVDGQPVGAHQYQGNGNGLVCPNDSSHKVWDNRLKKQKGEYKATAPDGKCADCDFKFWPAKA